MVFVNDDSGIAVGTSFKGYVTATFDELIDAFGQPTFTDNSGDDKVSTEWNLAFHTEDDEFVATIYDWKCYDNGATCRSGNPFVWNVGGNSYESLQAVKDVLEISATACNRG
jgi:hypothetical protein